jgi:1-acyl-sn-glycerol-3-phosphate acyltransferase
MKKYYAPLKPYYKVPRPHLFFKAAFAIGGLFMKPKVILSEELPDEPVIFMANHAFDYGPRAMLFAQRVIKRKFRTWSNANAITAKNAPNQMMKTTFPNVKKPLRYLVRLFSYVAAPVMGRAFKAAGVIPVYRDMRVKTTYTKTFESLKDGYDVVIFPDSIIPDPDNPYIDKVQRGAFKTFEMCRRFLNKTPKLYPVYACKALNTVCVGNALTFDTEIPAAEAEEKLEKALADEIKRLALALPPHKITHSNSIPKDLASVKKYLTYNEEKMYAQLDEINRANAEPE